MKKTLTLAMVVLMVFAALAGCKPTTQNPTGAENQTLEPTVAKTEPPAEGTTAPTTEKVVITTSFSEAEMGDAAIEGFETTYPNIDLQVKELGDVTVLAAIAAGNAPDCVRVVGVRDTPQYVARGLAVNLDDYIANSTYTKPLLEAGDNTAFADVYCWDGKVQGQGPRYGFAKDFSQDNTLWVNTEMFAEAGVDLPSETEPMTWQHMFELAKKVSVVGDDGVVQTYGYGNLDTGSSGFNFTLVQLCLQQMGNYSLWSDDYLTCDFTKPEVKQVFEMFINAFNDNKGILSPISPNTDNINVLFSGQKAAFGSIGYWYSGSLRTLGIDMGWTEEQLNTKAKLYPAPYWEGGQPLSPTFACTGGIMYARTPNPDETFAFMDYFFSGPPAIARSKTGWGLPQWKSFFDYLPQDTLFDQQTYRVSMDELDKRNGFVKYNPYVEFSGIGSIFNDEMLIVLQGGGSLDTALQNLTTKVQGLIDEGYALVNK